MLSHKIKTKRPYKLKWKKWGQKIIHKLKIPIMFLLDKLCLSLSESGPAYWIPISLGSLIEFQIVWLTLYITRVKYSDKKKRSNNQQSYKLLRVISHLSLTLSDFLLFFSLCFSRLFQGFGVRELAQIDRSPIMKLQHSNRLSLRTIYFQDNTNRAFCIVTMILFKLVSFFCNL